MVNSSQMGSTKKQIGKLFVFINMLLLNSSVSCQDINHWILTLDKSTNMNLVQVFVLNSLLLIILLSCSHSLKVFFFIEKNSMIYIPWKEPHSDTFPWSFIVYGDLFELFLITEFLSCYYLLFQINLFNI